MPISINSATPPTPPQGPNFEGEARKLEREINSLVYEIDSMDRTNYRDEENLTSAAGTILQLGLLIDRNQGI